MPKAKDIPPYVEPTLIISEDEKQDQVRFYLSDRGDTIFATLEYDFPDEVWVLRWTTNKAIQFETQQRALAFINRSYLNMANPDLTVGEVFSLDWEKQRVNIDE